MIRFLCPGCQKTLGVDDSRAKSVGTCPKCKTKFLVPEAPVPEPVPPPPPAVVVRPFVVRDTAPPPPITPSRRKPTRDVEDEYDEEEDRPRRKSRRYEEDEDTVPRSRKRRDEDQWEIVEEDEDEEEERRPKRKSKKKRKKKKSAGFLGDGDTFGMYLGGYFGISLLFIMIAFVFPPAIFLVFIASYMVMFAANIWWIVLTFQDSVMEGVLCMFVPFYALYYLLMNFDYVKRPFYVGLVSFLIILIAIGFAALVLKPG